MNRCLAFLLAVIFATITVSSAVAAPSEWVAFTLRPDRSNSGKIHAEFRSRDDQRGNNWSTGFPPSELIGFDAAGFRGAATRPLRFAIAREAGRLDCSGTGGNGRAAGNCRFTADPGFLEHLASRGIVAPSREQAFGLTAVNARREVVDALAEARYPTPTIDDLMALSALGVDRRYIGEMARAGYRPAKIHTLVEFKALGITPEWIGGFARAGYAAVPASDLVQLQALAVTPEFIAGFDRIGYRRLPVGALVQLKALGVTPEFALAANRQNERRLSVDQLVQLKALGLGPRMR